MNEEGDTLRNEDRGMDENPETTLNHYQRRAIDTAMYPGRGEGQIIYPVIAMAEEAGELAGEVRLLLHKQQNATGTRRDYAVAEIALTLSAACGAVLGLVKKAYRNDPQGELNDERRARLQKALTTIEQVVGRMSDVVRYNRLVEFPPIPVAGEERDKLVKETGDVLWYVAAFCTEARTSLGYVGDTNYAKLEDRKRRDAIRSTGDDR
jgi:NTP pyrophosphatase (non-canonical NTP hydrolase)